MFAGFQLLQDVVSYLLLSGAHRGEPRLVDSRSLVGCPAALRREECTRRDTIHGNTASVAAFCVFCQPLATVKSDRRV